MIKFEEVVEHSQALVSAYANRNSMYDELEDMYLLKPRELPRVRGNWIKQTVSPAPRNKLNGMVRLLTATEPHFRMPYELTDADAQKSSDMIEKMAGAIWQACGVVNKRPLHHDVVFSACLYGEVNIAVSLTQDLYNSMPNEKKMRVKSIMENSPVIFRVLPAKRCYPEFDSLGLSAHLYKKSETVQRIISFYGKLARELENRKRMEKVILNEYWNDTVHTVWVDGVEEPLIHEEHDLPFIPISTAVVEGSEMFSEEEQQQTRQPLLYGLWASKIWERECLMLTAIYTNVYTMAASPQLVYKRNMDDRELSIDYSVPGSIVHIANNESVEPLMKVGIDQSLITGLEIADKAIEESTIYAQTLGEPLGGNPPFSSVALLSQAGRQPLIPYQRISGYIIADAMKKALHMLRDAGGSFSVFGSSGRNEYKASDIPEAFELDVYLEPDLPQDMRQNAAVAVQLVREGLISRRYAMEKHLNIEQPDTMMKDIWVERYADFEQQMDFEAEKVKIQQRFMAQQQQVQQQILQQPAQKPINGEEQSQLMMRGGGAQNGLVGMPMAEPSEFPKREIISGEEELPL